MFHHGLPKYRVALFPLAKLYPLTLETLIDFIINKILASSFLICWILHIFLQIEIITVSLSNAARKNMVIFNVIRGKITRILLVEVILIFNLSRNSISAYTIKFFDKCSAKSNILSY